MKKRLSIFALSMGSGGAERVISLMLSKLEKEYDVSLFLVFNVFHYAVPANVRVVLVSEKQVLSPFEKIFLIPKTFIKYFKFLRAEKIEVAISFLTIPNLINGLTKFFHKKNHIIISERNYPSIEYKSSLARFYVYKFLIPILYSKADLLFSNSIWINKDLSENFGVKTKMKVIYNPILLPKTVKLFPAIANDQLNLINVGRVFATKNQKIIIEAVANIKNHNYHLTILGDGVMKEELSNYVNQHELKDHIEFVGNVADVNKYLIESDCFILSSNSEGFPNALLEAMAMGLPVISTNCKSGPLEILNDNEEILIEKGSFAIAKYGFLVNVNDSVGLYHAIMYLSNNKSLLDTYSKKSLSRANDYNLDKIYNTFKSVIIRDE